MCQELTLINEPRFTKRKNCSLILYYGRTTPAFSYGAASFQTCCLPLFPHTLGCEKNVAFFFFFFLGLFFPYDFDSLIHQTHKETNLTFILSQLPDGSWFIHSIRTPSHWLYRILLKRIRTNFSCENLKIRKII